MREISALGPLAQLVEYDLRFVCHPRRCISAGQSRVPYRIIRRQRGCPLRLGYGLVVSTLDPIALPQAVVSPRRILVQVENFLALCDGLVVSTCKIESPAKADASETGKWVPLLHQLNFPQ